MNCKIATTTLLLGCTTFIGCKASEGASAGYVDKTMMHHNAAVPFHKVWRSPDVDFKKYTKLHVASVDTSYMLKETEWQKGMRQDEIEADVKKLGRYTHDSLAKAFRDDPHHRFTVVESDTKSPDTLVFEFAIVEVVPSKVVLNALGYAPFGIGMAISAVRGLAGDVSTIAFEARGRDAATGQIVFMAADREAEQKTIVDLRGLTWYSHAYGIIDSWSKQFVQAANRKPDETVKDTSAFRLRPW